MGDEELRLRAKRMSGASSSRSSDPTATGAETEELTIAARGSSSHPMPTAAATTGATQAQSRRTSAEEARRRGSQRVGHGQSFAVMNKTARCAVVSASPAADVAVATASGVRKTWGSRWAAAAVARDS